MDNFVVAYTGVDSAELADEFTMYKKNIDIILKKHGYNDNSVMNLTDNQIFDVQQCLLWKLINGGDYTNWFGNVNQNAMYKAMIDECNAQKAAGYTSDGTSYVIVSKGDNFDIKEDGKIGPFILNNAKNQINKITVSGISDEYKIVDANNNEIPEYNKYNGEFYINVNKSFSAGTKYSYNGIVSVKSYTTSAWVYSDGWATQSVGELMRYPQSSSVDFNTEYLKGNPDLALKKMITEINNINVNEDIRSLDIDASDLIGNQKTTATYNMRKKPIEVDVNDVVKYRIYIFNESKELDGYAKEITDYIPNGMRVARTENNINSWKLYKSDGSQVSWDNITDEELDEVVYITTNKLQDTKIEKLTDANSLKGNSKFVEVELEVESEAEGILTNISEITDYGYKDENDNYIPADQKGVDRDSEQNNATVPENRDGYWGGEYNEQQQEPTNYPGQQDDDDFEKVIVNKSVDLALKKTIVKVENSDKSKSTNYNRFDNRGVSTSELKIGNSTTADYYMNKDTIQVTQGDYVTYRIYVFNEGNVNATASKIKDTFLSTNLEYDKNDEINQKYGWGDAATSNGVTTVSTTYLNNNLIERYNKGDSLTSAFVEIRLKVKDNAETNLRLTNIAQISEYQTLKEGTIEVIEKDIDSEPDNIILPNTDQDWTNYWGGCNLTKFETIDESKWYYVEGQDRGNAKRDDDDDFDSIIVNPKPEFDLALRKFITAVNDKQVDANETKISRIPVVKEGLIQQENTAGYLHTKDAVKVENGDIVTYAIRVYNEGDLAGKATKVTDYLPDGLEFYSSTVDGIDYKWTEETKNGKRCITTNFLNERNALPAYNGNDVQYNVLKVKLKVNVTDTSKGQYLTNRAEITEDVAYDSDGNVTNVDDRDSVPADMAVENNLVNTYYNNRVTNGNPRIIDGKEYYYEEHHDDEDFDTVYVKPRTKFDINLLKVAKDDLDKDTPTALNGAKFNVVEVDPNDVSKVIGKVKPVTTTNESVNIIHETNRKVGTMYAYRLEEAAAPNGFNKVIDIPLYILIRVDEEGNISNESIRINYDNVDYMVEDYYRLAVDPKSKSITVRIGNPPNVFDLALRKYITGINSETITSREPRLDVLSWSMLQRTGTSGYYHTKEAMQVKKGDIVTYTIRVFNEGQVKGYATEITDYLPDGLEFVKNSEVNRKYGWTVSEDGKTVKTTKLSNTLLNENGLKDWLLGKETPTWHACVEIQCKVTANSEYNIQYLTNRAEITQDKAVSVDENGKETVLELEDRDSTPNNVKKDHQNDMLNYDPNPNPPYNSNTFYEGYEDDDDKETVYINPITKVEFKINKIDNISKESIAGAKFRIEPNVGSDGQTTPITSIVDSKGKAVGKNTDGTYTIPKGGVTVTSNNVEVGKESTYYIEEVKAPTGYNMGSFKNMVITIDTKLVNGEVITNSNIANMTYIEYTEQNGHIISSDKIISNTKGIEGIATLNNDKEILVTIENQNTDTFDLALRKYITNISNTSTKKNENYSREPKFNANSTFHLRNSGTAWYFHNKDALKVETGDIVTYTIRVYNESDIKGKVAEITDYLPQGLEYYSSKVDNIDYKWTATKNEDGTTTLKTNYLKDTMITENQLDEFLNKSDDGKWYADVKVKCKVVATNSNQIQYLTNRAEITAHEDERGNKFGDYYKVYNNTDRDSVPNTIKNNLNLNDYYENSVLANRYHGSSRDRYYYGTATDDNDDDDDFETVMLEAKTDFELKVKKLNAVNDSPFTNQINFKVEEISLNADINNITSADILSTENVPITGEGKLKDKNKIPVNTEYRYRITEELPKALQEKYKTSTREAIIKIKVDNNGKISAQIEKWNDTTWNKNIAGKYCYVNVNGKTVNLTFENEPIAKYSVIIEKVDQNGTLIKDKQASFKVNKNTNPIYTFEGIAEIEEEKEITKDKQSDKYSITEHQAPQGYGKFEGTIALNVISKIGTENYEIDKDKSTVQVTKIVNGKTETETISLNTMGEEVGYFIEDGTIPVIKLKVKNPETHGKYSIEAVKVDENGTPIENNKASFIVTNAGKSYERPTGDNGIATVVEDKNISTIGQMDLYSITENSAPQRYVKFDGNIILSIVSKVDPDDNTRYIIDREKSQVSIRGSKSMKVDSLANFDNLNGTFPEGLEATVYIDEKTDANRVKVLVKNNPEGKYNFVIEKVDDKGEPITKNQAEFTYIYNQNSAGKVKTNYDTGIATIETKSITSDQQKDNFKVTETKKPSGYNKFDGEIIVNTASKLEDGKYKLDTNNTTVTVIKVVDGQTTTTTIPLDTMGEEVGFFVEDGDIPTIKLKVKNPKITGKFGAELIKVDGNGVPVKNNKATFIVDGTLKWTDEEGALEIAKDVNITENAQEFNYSINEKDAPDGFTLFNENIILSILTKEENGKYTIDQKNAYLQVGNSAYKLGSLNGEFKEGQNVTAYVDESGDYPIVKIKVKNILKGKYNLELEKVDDKGTTIENNPASFSIKTSSNPDKPIPTNDKGKIAIETGKEITNASQEDKYQITELNAPTKYAKFEGVVNVNTKSKLEDGKYVLDRENTTVEVTKRINGKDYTETIKLNTMGKEVGFFIEEGDIPTIKIKVANPPIDGRYSVELIKVDDNGTPIENNQARFNVNNEEKNTNDIGILNVVENKKFENENEKHDYVIKETKAPDGFALYENNISLHVFAESKDDSYVINETASVLDVQNEGMYTLSSLNGEFAEGKNVTAFIDKSSSIPVIKIKVKNVQKGKYNIELIKVDENGEPVKNNPALFNLITPSVTEQRGTGLDGVLTVESNREITSTSQSDVYTITEETAPDGFIKFDGTIKVTTKSKKESGEFVLDKNNTKVEVTKVVNGTSKTETIRLDTMGEEVGFFVEDGDIPTIKIKVENPKITGKYALKLIKVDGNGKPIENNQATFNVNGEYKNTNNKGVLDIETGKDITSKNQRDIYVIQETDAPNGYTLYPNMMNMLVYSKQDGNKYTINKEAMRLFVAGVGDVEMSSKLGEFKNENVAWFVDDKVDIPTITIHVKDTLQGKYNVELVKVDDKGTEVKDNPAQFKIDKSFASTNNKPISTNSDGKLLIEENRGIESTDQNDEYTIKEERAPEGYKKYDGEIKVLPKFKIESGKLVLDKANTKVTANGIEVELNTMKDQVGFYFVDGETPTIRIKVANPPIEGKYGVRLIKVDENGEPIKDYPATFKIKSTEEVSIDTNSDEKKDGGLSVVDSKTIENENQYDTYTITEEKAPYGYIRFKGEIKLNIFAEKQGDSYIINKNASVLEVESEGNYSLKNLTGEFEEGKSVTGYIDESGEIPVVVIKVKNPPITGKFDLRIKKVNSINPSENIDGVVFTETNGQFDPVTTENGGIAKLSPDEGIIITKENQKFNYFLVEESVPDKYTKISYHGIWLQVYTRLSDDKESYVVKNVSVQANKIAVGPEEDIEQEKAMLDKGLSYEGPDENGMITITVPNQPTTDYKLEVNKVDKESENEFIEKARFTIDGPNGNIQTDEVLKADEKFGKFVEENNGVKVNKTYTYTITETFAPVPYENVFKIGDQTLSIKVDIVIDANGKVDQRKSEVSLIVPDGLNISGGENARAYTRAYECIQDLTFDNNTVKLNIKNPQMKVDYNLELFKHQLKNENKGIEGAKFKVQRKQKDDEEWETLNDVDNPLESLKNQNVLIDKKEKVSIDNTYYYMVEEIDTPNANFYLGKIKAAVIRVSISDMAEVTADIDTVKLTGTNEFIAYNEAEHGENIKLEKDTKNNKFTLKLPNSVGYALELYKVIDREGDNDYETARGGKFKVYKVKRGENGTPTATEITPQDGVPAPWDSGIIQDANPNSRYEYWIEEIEGPDGLVNDFENVTIQLFLRVDSEGNVMDIGVGGSTLDFLSTTDKSFLPAETRAFLYGKCKVNVNKNRVHIDLKDSPVIVEPKKYGIQLLKVNAEDPSEHIEGVEFGVSVYAAGATGIPYDADEETDGIQNPVTNKDGIIDISGIEIVEGETQLFRITERSHPEEYKALDNLEIDVRVDLDGITDASQITKDDINVVLTGEGANRYPEGYIKTNVTKDGVVQIIVPNEPNKYQFVLNKKDEIGNLIKADETSNGSLEGASIYVRNQETGEYLFLNSVLEDGTRSRMVNCKANTEYEYRIVETESKPGYVNILQGYELVLHVVTDANGEVKEVKQGDSEYTRYSLGQTPNPHVFRLPESTVMDLIDVKVVWEKTPVLDESGNQVLDENGSPKEETVRQLVVDIENPKAYSFRLTKLDTKGNRVEQVVMDATKVVNGVETNYKVSLNNKSTELQQGIRIMEGEEQVWRVREENVNIPYYNVLPDGAYTDITVKCENGKMKVLKLETFDKNGNPMQITKDTISASPEQEMVNGEEVISVALINPMQYIIGVDKVIEDTDGNYTSLHGAGIKVVALTPDRNGNCNKAETNSTNGTDLKVHQIADLEKVYRYRIEEFSTPVGHINVFEGKFVEFNVHFDSNKKPVVSDLGVYYNNNGERGDKIPVSDEIYDNIEIKPAEMSQEGIYYIKAYIVNPIEYDFELTKVKTDTNKTELPGTEIKVNNTFVIRDGESSYKTSDTIKINEEKTYWIEEVNSTGNHVNVLNNMLIKVTVKMKLTENGKEAFEIVNKELYQKAGNKKVKLPEEAEKVIFSYVTIYPEKNAETGKHTLKARIENPVQYMITLYKVKTDNKTGLYGATLTYNGNEVIKETTTPKYQTYAISKVGEIRTFDIKELSTKDGYVNILEGDKTLRIKATINNDEKLEILSTTIVETVDGAEVEKPLSECEDLKDYITVEPSKVTQNNVEYESIEIKVQNPREYKFRVTKLKSNNETLLKGAIIRVDGKVVMDGTQATYEEINVLDIGESHTITIEEDKTVAGNVNILKDKKLIITATVLPNENLSIEKRLVTNDEKQTEITDKNILKYFEAFEQTTAGNIKTLCINIINPDEYKLKIVKIDKDTKERMNNIRFDVSVFDENNEEIKLKDSNTFKDKSLTGLVTSNVDGEDGIIKIENILIERTGTFTFKFHETQKYGYVSIPDVEAKVTIVEENGNYVVKSIEVIDGKEVVNTTETEVILEEPETIQVEIENERIKGEYDIILNKVDKVTLKKLDGAKFKLTVQRDGKDTELYKQTDDVKSKDVIIPSEVTVKNGTLVIEDIRIDREDSYIIKLEEVTAPDKYIDFDSTIELKVKTKIKDEKYVIDNVELLTQSNLVTKLNDENRIEVTVKNEQFDLALRKYITKVITNEGKENEKVKETEGREPDVNTEGLKNKKETTAVYNQNKKPISVFKDDTIIYTLRVYNEGDVAGYAEEVTDHLPEYLEFVNDDFNSNYGWILDENDKSLRTVRTKYLSKANDPEGNLIKAFNNETGEIDYKEIQIKCKVKDTVPVKTKLTNIADITEFTDGGGNTVPDRDSSGGNVNIPEDSKLPNYKDEEIGEGKTYIPGQEDDDDFEKVIVEEFDLALRKFITGVTKGDGEKEEVTTRIPKFKVDENGNYIYEHTKEPVIVANQNVVEYTLRVYNEGTVDGYAKEIKDDIPNGLEFLPEDSLNKEYRWLMLDENGNETDKVNEAKYIVTDYLSKENEKEDGEYLLKAFDKDAYDAGAIKEPNYKEVKVAFKVTLPDTSDEIVINQAQISDDSDSSGGEVDDKDSTPNKWNEGEDDQDIEKIKVQYFDLALRKWVTKAIVIKDGKQEVHETGHKAEDDPEAVVKVDLQKSKLKDVVVKFEYQIRVTNEGQIPGYVKEISDYIPQGLKFVSADNPNWVEVDGKVTTDELKDTLLNKGESAEVTIVLTWINREDNMGLKINVAEISKDHNEYGSPDVDSTPNNKVPGEDDIDDAPVMLTVKTGEGAIYIGITMAVLIILASGVVLVKKYVAKKE